MNYEEVKRKRLFTYSGIAYKYHPLFVVGD